MAQLRYAKAVACGTALTAAGLAGYYLYTRNNLKKAKMKEKVEEGDIVGEENVGSGTQAIEARLQQEAKQELNMANAGHEANAKKCDSKNVGSCTNGCPPDIEAIEKVLEKLSAEDAQNTRNENENVVNKERQIEETITNVVDDFMMECSMDTNASSGSSLNASNEHIMEDLQALEESIPNPIHEITASTQPQPIQEAIVPTKRQSCESMRPPLDNVNRKTSSITNGNVLDNQTSTRASTTNSKSGRKAKHVNNAPVYNGKGSIASGKKGGNKKGNDLSKLQTVDWASSVLLDEKAHSSNGTSLGNNESNSTGYDVSSEVNSEGSSIDSGHGSRDSGASASPAAITQASAMKEGPVMYQFEFPSKLCGRLIGKSGKNIRELKDKTGAKVILKNVPYSTSHQICVVEGLRGEVDGALAYIKKKFPSVDLSRRANTQQQKKNKSPDMTQLHLPEETPNSILISSVVSGGHIFIQQPVHQTYQGLNVQDNLMTQIYQQADMTPQLPRPIENGVICAAPVMDGWYRAQVVEVTHETDEVDVRFLDYGGYARVEAYALRQIRSDFLGLPFQATECYMSNIAPLPGDADFSESCRIFIEQLAQSIGVMQATISGYSVDGIPFIEIFFIDSFGKSQSLNKELVNQGLVSWYEGTEAAEPSPDAVTNGALYSMETLVRPS
ncbi:A-kinase anchor protein 1, mitochondrial [Strongylocentrotus purpuratus]|uniref:Tudor domain-containing protein n=1 Tax=Strongylocentrotus purpuratus TaxID=7668 RepID=A0A7M7G4D1_STRPU|nr:A-kinase anchor protein 1, mitochondrial [Strongylocentrotus purpuratus]XP_003726488.2 A-kinase anchor protein 1, mitochondrial [Strongylocentrotus purpuratus]